MWMNWWIGRQPYDNQPDRWSATGARPDDGETAQASGPEAVTPMTELAARTRDSGCSTEIAREAVRGRSLKDLANGWRATTTMLRTESSPSRLLAVVLLREAILDEMECQEPRVFAAWLAEQYGRDRTGRG